MATVRPAKKDVLSRLAEHCLHDPNIIFAVVFGSYVAGKRKKPEDVDLAVYFIDPPEGPTLLALMNALSVLAGKDVDLVALNHASAFLRHQVMRTGMPLIIKDPTIYRKFREKTMSDYDEYKYVSNMDMYDR